MLRRKFLTVTVVVFGTVTGCMSRGRSSGGSTDHPCTTKTPSDSEISVSTNTESFVETYPPEKPITEIVIGDEQDQSTEIPDTRIENETDALREITATVLKGAESPTEVLRANCEVASGEYVSIAPTNVDTYTIQVKADSIEGQSSLTIEPWMFEDGQAVTCHINIRTDTIETQCGGGGSAG